MVTLIAGLFIGAFVGVIAFSAVRMGRDDPEDS
jgi:hypothetical protein